MNLSIVLIVGGAVLLLFLSAPVETTRSPTVISTSQKQSTYSVISCYDGDTIWVKDSKGDRLKIRFAVVDANEIKQDGGVESRDYLRSLLPVNTKVNIVFTGNKSHNRSVATIYANGININLQMLKSGHAVIDTRYLKQVTPESRIEYQKAEASAKAKKLGRWEPRFNQEMPWEWRKKNAN